MYVRQLQTDFLYIAVLLIYKEGREGETEVVQACAVCVVIPRSCAHVFVLNYPTFLFQFVTLPLCPLSPPVLLDEFVNTVGAIKDSQNEAISQSRDCVLDPLLERLAHFNTSQDLSSPILKSSLLVTFIRYMY